MRYLSLAFVFAFISFSTLAHAQTEKKGTRTEIDSATGQKHTVTYDEVTSEQDITPRKNMLVINPLKFLIAFYNLTYYRRVSPVTVVGFGLQYPSFLGLTGIGANAEARFHPSARAMRGFYVAPNISYTSVKYDYLGVTSPAVGAFSVGGLLGWQWFPGDEFAMGLGIGLDYYFLMGPNDGNHYSVLNGTLPALRFDIGYAWE